MSGCQHPALLVELREARAHVRRLATAIAVAEKAARPGNRHDTEQLVRLAHEHDRAARQIAELELALTREVADA